MTCFGKASLPKMAKEVRRGTYWRIMETSGKMSRLAQSLLEENGHLNSFSVKLEPDESLEDLASHLAVLGCEVSHNPTTKEITVRPNRR